MSAGIGALIAHVTFWVLLARGWFREELGVRGIVTFLALWTSGSYGLRFVPGGPPMFFSWVALLDVALVFVIFKSDVRLT
jgi:hypothetical protein